MNTEPQDVRGIIKKIFKLEERIKNDTEDVKRLERLLKVEKKERKPRAERKANGSVPPETSIPDLREAILTLFGMSDVPQLKIGDVVWRLRKQYGFEPDKIVITSRMNYMADRDSTLERVPNRRGFYRLPTKATEAGSSGG